MLYMPLAPPRRPSRTARWWAAGVLAACAVAAPTFAEQVGSSFRITINLVADPAQGSCTASTEGLSCQPLVVGGTGTRAAPGDGESLSYATQGVRVRDASHARVAGEMIEVGNENHAAWQEGNHFALGETSTRLVVAGGFEYVERTVSW